MIRLSLSMKILEKRRLKLYITLILKHGFLYDLYNLSEKKLKYININN